MISLEFIILVVHRLMLSREEWTILQRQMVQMTDEKLDMIAQIRSLQESNVQIGLIKNTIQDIKSSKAKEEAEILSKISRIQSKINTIQESIRLEGDPNRSLNWDEKKKQKLEQKLKSAISASVAADDTISELENRLKEKSQFDDDLDVKITELQGITTYRKNTYKKVGKFGVIGLHINDLESRYIQTQKQCSIIHSSIETTQSTIQFYKESNSIMEKTLQEKNELNQSITNQIAQLEPDNLSICQELEELKEKSASIMQTADKNIQDLHKEEEVSQELFETEQKTTKIYSDNLEQLNSTIENMTQSIEQRKIDNEIMINKKKTLIQQLKKSIKEKVNDITRSRSNSPYVLRLIESQEQHWIERQQMYEVYKVIYARHIKETEKVSRKSLILEEIKLLSQCDKKSASDPISELKHMYLLAQNFNKELVTKVQNAQLEIQQLSQENQTLDVSVSQLNRNNNSS